MSKKQERQIEEKVFRQTAQDEIEKIINPPEENEAPIILTAKERQKAEIERQEEIARRKNLNKINEKRQREEEYMGAVASKRNAKARKIAHHRHLKNFGWWVTGFFSFILAIVIALGIVFAVIPLKTYFGDDSDKYINDEIAESTPLQIVQNITTYKAGDVPAIELLLNTILEDYELNKFISVDIDTINKATLVSSEFTEALSNGIKIIATLRSLELDESLGDLGNTSAFKEFELVPNDKLPDFSSDDFNEKLYYYQLADGRYARAFDDDGNRIAESEGKDLYYPALVDVMLLDLPAVLTDRLETMKVSELLNCFGMDETNTFTQIVEDRTIGEMKDFDINTVKLSVVFPVDGNETLKNTLIDMTYQSVIEKLACEDYLSENTDKTKEDWLVLSEEEKQEFIDTVTTYPEDKDEQFELITIGDLENADMNKVKLSSVMNDIEHNEMIDILVDMSGKERSDLTVGDLAEADVTKIKISSVMPEDESNRKLFCILEDMTKINLLDDMACDIYLSDNPDKTEDDWEELSDDDKSPYLFIAKEDFNELTRDEKHELIRVVHLGNGDVTHIRLVSILDYDKNERLYRVLRDLSSKNVIEQYIFDNYEGITRDNWRGKLDSEVVADGRTRGELWNEASARYYGIDNYVNSSYDLEDREAKKNEIILNYINYKYALNLTDVNDLTPEQIADEEDFFKGFTDEEKNDLITIASLDEGDIKLIQLTSVLSDSEENEKLYSIIRDMTGKETNAEIKVGDLENVDIEHIKLLNVLPMGDSENPLKNEKLYNVLKDLSYENVISEYSKSHGNCPRSEAEDYYNGLSKNEQLELITVASLDGAGIDDIKLKSVMVDEPSNKLLATLWQDNTVTVGNMTEKLDALPVGKVYEKEVFTMEESKKVDEAKYTMEEIDGKKVYTLDASGSYYISKEASVWLVMLYDCEGISTDGYGLKYTENLKTVSEMEGSIGDISGAIKTASIRQLIEMDIIEDSITYTGSYDKKLSALLSGS